MNKFIKLKLKFKVSIDTYNKDDVIIIFNDMLSIDNGLCFKNINSEIFEILSIDEFTGFYDSKTNKIYNNEYFEYKNTLVKVSYNEKLATYTLQKIKTDNNIKYLSEINYICESFDYRKDLEFK